MIRQDLISNLWYRQPNWASWSKSFLLSLFLHLCILGIGVATHGLSNARTIAPIVYNVELVGSLENMTAGYVKGASVLKKAKKSLVSRGTANPRTTIPIWRVTDKDREKEKVEIEKVPSSLSNLKADTGTNVGEKLEKLTNLVAQKEKERAKRILSANLRKHQAKVSRTSSTTLTNKGVIAGGYQGSRSSLSLVRSTYYTMVWDHIRREWALPEELVQAKGNLTAILIIKIRRDGKIMEANFEKHSGDRVFDDSVWRAVWKSDPLPPFPEIYSPKYDELGIRFKLSELLK